VDEDDLAEAGILARVTSGVYAQRGRPPTRTHQRPSRSTIVP